MARALISVTGAATDTAVIAAPGAGLAIQVNRVHYTVSSAATVSLSNGTDGATTRISYGDFAANGGIVLDSYGNGPSIYPVATLSANTALNITNSAGNLKGVVDYVVVPRAV